MTVAGGALDRRTCRSLLSAFEVLWSRPRSEPITTNLSSVVVSPVDGLEAGRPIRKPRGKRLLLFGISAGKEPAGQRSLPSASFR